MPLRILQLGYGHVGRALCQILPDGFEYAGVANSKGVLVSPNPDVNWNGVSDLSIQAGFVRMDSLSAVNELDYDVLVDLTPTNLETAEPSFSLWKAAFARGKHVVTANKGPLALRYGDVRAAARAGNVRILHEATVAGGTPVFALARHGLRGAKITSVEGILNGSTNYILSQMQAGRNKEEVMAEAREKGYLEANPDNDLLGGDALAKAVILANAFFNQNTRYADHVPQGIKHLTDADVAEALKAGECFKLIARVDSQSISVAPQRLKLDHPLAQIGDAWNALTFYTEHADAVTIKGRGAGGMPTASAVLNDLWELYG